MQILSKFDNNVIRISRQLDIRLLQVTYQNDHNEIMVMENICLLMESEWLENFVKILMRSN